MEVVSNMDEISSLNENKINGNPKMQNSKITFAGKNNLLFCENNVNLIHCNIVFKGNDSLIYLSSCKGNYSLNMQVVHDSVIYIGKNNDLIAPININVQEHQNLIIGDDCSIGSNTNIRTGDAHIIYDKESKNRINKGSSVFIGDHVWLGHQIYVDKGVTAVDKDGNDITNNVVTVITGSGSSIDTSKLSNQYVINYTVSANGKTSTISRTVKIVDTPAPVINISSNVALTVSDTTFDLMNGVEVTDNSGETIEASVKSNITFGLPGTYTITYTAADSSGNKTIKHRILTITGTL